MSTYVFAGPLLSQEVAGLTRDLLQACVPHVEDVSAFFANWTIQAYVQDNATCMLVFIDPSKNPYRTPNEVLRRVFGVLHATPDSKSYRTCTFLSTPVAQQVSCAVNILRFFDNQAQLTQWVEIVETEDELIVQVKFENSNLQIGSSAKRLEDLFELQEEMVRFAYFDQAYLQNPVATTLVHFPSGLQLPVPSIAAYASSLVSSPEPDVDDLRTYLLDRYNQSVRTTSGVGVSRRCLVRTIVSFIGDEPCSAFPAIGFGLVARLLSSATWKRTLNLQFSAETATFRNPIRTNGVQCQAVEIIARVEWMSNVHCKSGEYEAATSSALNQALSKFKNDLQAAKKHRMLQIVSRSIYSIVQKGDPLTRDGASQLMQGQVLTPEAVYVRLQNVEHDRAGQINGENDAVDDADTVIVDDEDVAEF